VSLLLLLLLLLLLSLWSSGENNSVFNQWKRFIYRRMAL